MQARLKNPAVVLPDVMQPLQTFAKAIYAGPVPKRTLGLVHVRVSQINGCAACLQLHHDQDKRTPSDKDDRLHVVSAWRDTPFFTDAERAALALAEAETRLADR